MWFILPSTRRCPANVAHLRPHPAVLAASTAVVCITAANDLKRLAKACGKPPLIPLRGMTEPVARGAA